MPDFNLYRNPNLNNALDGRYPAGNAPVDPVTDANYFIAPTGSDSNDGLTPSTAFATPQPFYEIAQAGDIAEISAGTYTGNSGIQDGDSLVDFSFAAKTSGTQAQPITLRAKAGDERLVVIDGEDAKGGIHCYRQDYHKLEGIKFVNCLIGSIRNYSQVQYPVLSDATSIAKTWEIYNCHLKDVTSPASTGINTSHIAMWGTEDWTVMNNLIEGATAFGGTLAAGIQAYGAVNPLIKNNTIRDCDFGVFWKDHFLLQETPTRVRAAGSEICNNYIDANKYPVYIGIRGAGSVEAGDHDIHNNVLIFNQTDGAGIWSDMAGAAAQSGETKGRNNTIYNKATGGLGYSCSASDSIKMTGNIYANCSTDFTLIRFNSSGDAGKEPILSESDRNVFDTNFQCIVDRFGAGATTYSDLASWQAVQSTDHLTVDINNPDTNSTQSTESALFTDAANGDFTNKVGSPAIGLMPDGSNAGAYETGSEQIGVDF